VPHRRPVQVAPPRSPRVRARHRSSARILGGASGLGCQGRWRSVGQVSRQAGAVLLPDHLAQGRTYLGAIGRQRQRAITRDRHANDADPIFEPQAIDQGGSGLNDGPFAAAPDRGLVDDDEDVAEGSAANVNSPVPVSRRRVASPVAPGPRLTLRTHSTRRGFPSTVTEKLPGARLSANLPSRSRTTTSMGTAGAGASVGRPWTGPAARSSSTAATKGTIARMNVRTRRYGSKDDVTPPRAQHLVSAESRRYRGRGSGGARSPRPSRQPSESSVIVLPPPRPAA